jgi:hypothetical protein
VIEPPSAFVAFLIAPLRPNTVRIEIGRKMNTSLLKPLTAISLSLWLGALACVMGCAQPALASGDPTHRMQISECKTEAADDGSCCHHSREASKNKQSGRDASCCPSDATLIQKQDGVSPLQTDSFIATLAPSAPNSFELSASVSAAIPIVIHLGRDVLLQAHVLRI